MVFRRIGRDLSMTCAKMEKLTELAKKKSLFDDRTGEVEELSGIIKQDITGLNNQIASLQEMVKQRLSSSSKEHGNHTKLVVVGLQSKLANVGKVFQSVLENRTKVAIRNLCADLMPIFRSLKRRKIDVKYSAIIK